MLLAAIEIYRHHQATLFDQSKVSRLSKNVASLQAKHSEIRLCLVMQEASDALSKTADSDTVSTYQVSSVQLCLF